MKRNGKYLGMALMAAALTTTSLWAAADDTKTTNASSAAAPATKLDSLFPDPVIAKGKGFEIKRSRLDEAVNGVRENAASHGQQLTAEDMQMVEQKAFDRLLDVELLKQKATDADKAKAVETADKRMALVKKSAQSEAALELQLKAMNLSINQLRDRLIEEATAEQVLKDKVTVSDATVQKFYDDNPSQFEEPEMVRASHILVSTQGKTGTPLSDDEMKAKHKIAEDLLKRARAGEDFGKLAKEYSDDPGSKDNGGEYTFPRGKMVKEFEAAAFSLQTNQVSDIVTTQFGYHIIKLSEKIPAKKLEFAKVSEQIRDYLEGQQIQKILPDVMASLKKDANVEILDEQLKTLQAKADEAAKNMPKDGGLAMPK
jgi:peptidyl-prolyl cis-trans isomerase C